MSWPAPLRGLRAAIHFMTRVPIGGEPFSAEDWSWAPAHFPAVGLLIGGLSSLAFLAARHQGAALAATLAVAVGILATGAFHEDGLADTFDALGGAHGPKNLFEILRDSRLGTYGVTALIVTLLLRIQCLAILRQPVWLVLPLLHVLARTGPVWLMLLLPHACPEGAKSGTVSQGVSVSRGMLALLWAGAALVAAGALGLPLSSVAMLGALCAGVTVLAGRWFLRRAGGWTGDFLGATEQLCEVLGLVCLTLAPERLYG